MKDVIKHFEAEIAKLEETIVSCNAQLNYYRRNHTDPIIEERSAATLKIREIRGLIKQLESAND